MAYCKRGTGTVERSCRECGELFRARHDRVGLYCSYSCASKNKVIPNHRVTLTCGCGESFRVKRHRLPTARFCSRRCHLQWLHATYKGSNHASWKGGITKRKSSTRRVITRAVKAKGACEKCGATKRLQGHHKEHHAINFNRRDDPANIEVLCSDCHAKEHPDQSGMISYPPRRNGSTINCARCGKERYVPQGLLATAKYCSRFCLHRRNENG